MLYQQVDRGQNHTDAGNMEGSVRPHLQRHKTGWEEAVHKQLSLPRLLLEKPSHVISKELDEVHGTQYRDNKEGAHLTTFQMFLKCNIRSAELKDNQAFLDVIQEIPNGLSNKKYSVLEMHNYFQILASGPHPYCPFWKGRQRGKNYHAILDTCTDFTFLKCVF